MPFTINYTFIIKTTTRNEMQDVVIIWLFWCISKFFKVCLLLIKHLAFSIIYLKVVNFDFLLFDGKLKRGIVYKKMAMRAGDDERIANYEWPNNAFNLLNISRVLCFGILGSFLFNVNNKETRTTSIDIVLMFLSSRLSMLSLNLIRLLPIGTFDCRERYLYIGTFKNVFFV